MNRGIEDHFFGMLGSFILGTAIADTERRLAKRNLITEARTNRIRYIRAAIAGLSVSLLANSVKALVSPEEFINDYIQNPIDNTLINIELTVPAAVGYLSRIPKFPQEPKKVKPNTMRDAYSTV